jgi:hypothetical protein
MLNATTTMPWKCPACSTPIPHLPLEHVPRPNVVYRCCVCRLELIFDYDHRKLTVPPLRNTAPARRPRR